MAAQKLLFGNTEAGDLTRLFTGYFDTETGPKRAPESYARIAAAIAFAPAETLFLSDVVEELDAARAAGMRTVLLARDGAGCPADPGHPCVTSFDAIDPSAF